MQILRKKYSEENAAKRKQDAQQEVALANHIVAAFKPVDSALINSGLSAVWPIILHRLVHNLCNKVISSFSSLVFRLSSRSGKTPRTISDNTYQLFTCQSQVKHNMCIYTSLNVCIAVQNNATGSIAEYVTVCSALK